MDKPFSKDQMKQALLAVEPKITEKQMIMLQADYARRSISMERLAYAAGFKGGYRIANIQYGTLCGRVASQLGFTSPGSQTFTLATVSERRDAKGHFQWKLDDTVARAIEELGWVCSPVTLANNRSKKGPSASKIRERR